MFTDTVGYTAATQADEGGTLQLLRQQAELVRPQLAVHGGREVKSTGDGFLVEFDSALKATQCAVSIQRRIHERNAEAGLPPIRIRIGIHLGDVVHQGTDVLGDAVNIAARIEPIAEPGGICVSGAVFEQVRNKSPEPLEKLPPTALKGLQFPLDIYRIVLPWSVSGGAAAARMAEPPSSLDASRIVVLPFANYSPEASDEYFADGLTEELIEKLAHVPGLRVIARTTAMRYKNTRESAHDIAQTLHVGTVVECSIRKSGNRIRVTAQLVDASTEEHLWASRYDRELDDLFALQDEIAGKIAVSLQQHVPALRATAPTPLARPSGPETKDLEAYTLFLHGRKLFSEKGTEATMRQALAFFETAVERDPAFARAHVGLGEAVLWLGNEGVLPIAEANERGRRELELALRLNESLAEAHSALAGLMLNEDDMAGAEREARRAIELNPSLSDPYRWLAQLEAGRGRIGEAIRLLESGHQLDPVDVNVIAFLGRAYAYGGREADALAHWERTKSLAPYRTNAHLTEYYLARGEYDKSAGTLREMQRLRPDSVWTECFEGIQAARTGDAEGARRAIRGLEERAQQDDRIPPFFAGFVRFALGDEDAFVAAMQRSFEMHELPFLELAYSPLFAAARDDPRISEILRNQAEYHPGSP
jgi:adenylate cyclase